MTLFSAFVARIAHLVSASIILAFALAAAGAPADDGDPFDEQRFKGLELRTNGPAFMSGRVADMVVHPENHNVWYVAVGSGGVWKTINSGTTWNPIFDGQGSYSIGTITLDPANASTV